MNEDRKIKFLAILGIALIVFGISGGVLSSALKHRVSMSANYYQRSEVSDSLIFVNCVTDQQEAWSHSEAVEECMNNCDAHMANVGIAYDSATYVIEEE